MNIRDWPMDRIMQLPDWCFGRRWPISVSADTPDADPAFDISEAGLPEVAVVWEINMTGIGPLSTSLDISLSLGDQLPATDAEFLAMEPLFRDVTSRISGPNTFELHCLVQIEIVMMRQIVSSAGRRLVGRFIRAAGVSIGGSCILIVSSIPTEVPDWLLSR